LARLFGAGSSELKTRFDTLRRQHEVEAAGTARKTMADPNAHASAS
jgi:hypothetical protein